jgi:hypothetical protein
MALCQPAIGKYDWLMVSRLNYWRGTYIVSFRWAGTHCCPGPPKAHGVQDSVAAGPDPSQAMAAESESVQLC